MYTPKGILISISNAISQQTYCYHICNLGMCICVAANREVTEDGVQLFAKVSGALSLNTFESTGTSPLNKSLSWT